MADLRLRRLDFSRGVARRGPDANPFLRVSRPPDPGRPLRIGLHSAGMRDADAEERLIVGELLASARRRIFEVFRTPEAGTAGDSSVPTMEIREGGSEGRVGASLGDEWGYFRRRPHWRSAAAHWLQDQSRESDFVELNAARAVGADLIVTAKKDLLALRGRKQLDFDGLNILSPHEAFPLAGVWSRAIGRTFLGGMGWADWYSWMLTRAVTPAAWPGLAAFAHGERTFPGGTELCDLANSALARLDRLMRILDRMVVLWQGPGQDGLADEFDNAVLAIWGIHDNLALLAGKYLDADPVQERRWGFLQTDWRKAMEGVTDSRAGRLLRCIDMAVPYLKLSEEIRHHAVHRALLPTVGGGRIELSARMLGDIKGRLSQVRESPASWGIADEQGPHIQTVYVGDERYEEPREGSALLDPLPFTARLVAQAAILTDAVFRILDPASDPRLPEEARTEARRLPSREVPSDWMFSPEIARLVILCSPLSGLMGGPTGTLSDVPLGRPP